MVAVLSVRIMYCLQLVGKLSVPTIRRPGGKVNIPDSVFPAILKIKRIVQFYSRVRTNQCYLRPRQDSFGLPKSLVPQH